MGLVNIKDNSTSIIKPQFGIFNPNTVLYSKRTRNKPGIWGLKDVYSQQENQSWPFVVKKVGIKNQILTSSPVYNSVSAEKCASTVKLSSDVFCLVYASTNININYEIYSISKNLTLSEGGLISSEELGAVTTLSESSARVSEISSAFDEVSGRILVSITYGYGTGGDILGGSQTMTSKSATKIIIGKYNSGTKSISWAAINNLYDLVINTVPYNTDPTPINTPKLTAVNTPVTTSISTTITTGTLTTYSTPKLTTTTTLSKTTVSTFYFSTVTTSYPTPITTSVNTLATFEGITSLPTSITTKITTPSVITAIDTSQLTVVRTISGRPKRTLVPTTITTEIFTLGSTFITTSGFTSAFTTITTSTTTSVSTIGSTPVSTLGVVSINTLVSTPSSTSIATVGSTLVSTSAQTSIQTNITTLLSTQITTSAPTQIPGDPIVSNTPPSQTYSVCEVKNIGENKFIISTHGAIRVITLTSDTTYSSSSELLSSIIPFGGVTELLKTAWDSVSSEYVELGWDSVNSLSKIARYSVSGTTVTALDTTVLSSTKIPNSIGNIINIGERKYIWNDYEKVYQVTHNGSSFNISASPLTLGTIGTSNYNTVLVKDNTIDGFILGYFSNETTQSYNKIVNYSYSNTISGGTESNNFSLLASELSNNNPVNYVDIIPFEDNVSLLIYEYSSILYANILTLKSY